MLLNAALPLAALIPVLAAPIAWALGRVDGRRAVRAMVVACALTLVPLGLLLAGAARGARPSFSLPGFCGLGLAMRADGFRALYAAVAGGMWLVASVFSLDYFRREESVGRYAFFTLVTLGAVVGLFLSDTLYSAFLFFEVMSLASYPWVAHEETPEAMRAAQTYLYVAVIGGLAMLMGLFLLPDGLATAGFAALAARAEAAGTGALWLPAGLLLAGFGAKAGAFPLHIWLPKAHPVAPAPASALLSGLLTKAGVFGALVLTTGLMRGDLRWADLVFRLGVITMVLGGLLAIFSVNLKRALACSSLSQIGFILVGTGLCGLLGPQNGTAAYGTVEHMLNHSLFKLVLFLCAGAVAMNARALNLNDIRGWGRRKPAVHFAFLMGALGIAGIPGFSGYASKSLLHEALTEYIAVARAAGANPLPYQIGEWLFVLSGGMTLCYMARLYVCLFWRRNPARQAEYDRREPYLSPAPKAALCLCAALIPAMGLFPGATLSRAAALSLSFLGAEGLALPVRYFSAQNLLGAAKSVAVGAALCAAARLCLARKADDGSLLYRDRWPKRLDLEDGLYRPLLALLAAVGYGLSVCCDRLMDGLSAALTRLGWLVARALDLGPDLAHLVTSRTALGPRMQDTHAPVPVGNRLTYNAGLLCDRAAAALRRAARREGQPRKSFVTLFAAGAEEAGRQYDRVTRSISFGLLLFCIGLCATLMYLLL